MPGASLAVQSRRSFSHHVASMRLDRDLADAELSSDLLVQKSSDDQRRDLPFAPAERRDGNLAKSRRALA